MASPELSKGELSAWIDTLFKSTEGKIKVINLYQSLRLDLVKKTVLCSFIRECLSLGRASADEALNGFDDICRKDNSYFALNRVDPKSIKDTVILATTMNSLTFHQFVVGRPKSVVKSTLPNQPKSRDDDDVNEYLKLLTKIISYDRWYNNSGTLGKPFPKPSHVWFTYADSIDKEITINTRSTTNATKIRDALGLIDTKDVHYLLLLRFPAAYLHTVAELQMARPIFSDNGNRRFAVYINTDAEGIYKDKWGQTIH